MSRRLKTIIAVTITVAIYPMVVNAMEKEDKINVNNSSKAEQVVIKNEEKNAEIDKENIVKIDTNIGVNDTKENLQEEKNINVDSKQNNLQNNDTNDQLDIKNNEKIEGQEEKESVDKKDLGEIKNDINKENLNTNNDENKNEVFNLTIDNSKEFFEDEKEYYVTYNKKSNKYNLFKDENLKEKDHKIEELYNRYNKIVKNNIKDKTIFIDYINTEYGVATGSDRESEIVAILLNENKVIRDLDMVNDPEDYFTLYSKSEFCIIDNDGKYIANLREKTKIFKTYKFDNKVIVMSSNDPNKRFGGDYTLSIFNKTNNKYVLNTQVKLSGLPILDKENDKYYVWNIDKNNKVTDIYYIKGNKLIHEYSLKNVINFPIATIRDNIVYSFEMLFSGDGKLIEDQIVLMNQYQHVIHRTEKVDLRKYKPINKDVTNTFIGGKQNLLKGEKQEFLKIGFKYNEVEDNKIDNATVKNNLLAVSKNNISSKKDVLPKTGESIPKHLGFFTIGSLIAGLGIKLRKKH